MTVLARDELTEIERFLNKRENNGFLVLNLYTRPEDINVWPVFYDGANLNKIKHTDWSEQEQTDVLGTAHWEYTTVFPFKLKKTEVQSFFKEKTGLTLGTTANGLNEELPFQEINQSLHYSTKYNSYYVVHGDDTMYATMGVTSGEIRADGLYTIHYTDMDSYDSVKYTVTLRRIADGYQFISNAKD